MAHSRVVNLGGINHTDPPEWRGAVRTLVDKIENACLPYNPSSDDSFLFSRFRLAAQYGYPHSRIQCPVPQDVPAEDPARGGGEGPRDSQVGRAQIGTSSTDRKVRITGRGVEGRIPDTSSFPIGCVNEKGVATWTHFPHSASE